MKDIDIVGSLAKMGVDKRLLYILVVTIAVCGCILIINYLYLRTFETLFWVINILALFMVMFPPVMIKYIEYGKHKEVEEMFPIFLNDFVESVRGGMPIPQAFKNVSRNDYRSLTPYIKKMTAQMDWGIPVEKVLLKFAVKTKSKFIARIVSSVIESHRFGGNLAETFEALSKTSLEVEKLRAERKLYMSSQMMTGYIIFFVFLAVIIGLEKFLTPSLSQIGPSGLSLSPQAGSGGGGQALVKEYRSMYRALIFIQGFFAGLSVGKMAEGSLISGLKHSMFMMFAGGLAFTLITGLNINIFGAVAPAPVG
jgi:flagellar protein FlaJ